MFLLRQYGIFIEILPTFLGIPTQKNDYNKADRMLSGADEQQCFQWRTI